MRKRRRKHASVVGPSKPRLWRLLGPGLITGAADDDPSGIATYAQAGAQYGFALGWMMLATFPLMFVIQAICARIGRTTGRGIAGNLRTFYAPWLLNSIVMLLFVANVLNIGADLGAMAETACLLLPGRPWMYVTAFGLICILGQVLFKHTRYVAVLKWLTLSLLSYFATLLAVKMSWKAVITGVLLPHLSSGKDFWLLVVAMLGTTISPYLFFWQAAQEVEDTKAAPRREPLLNRPQQSSSALQRINLDTAIGMGFSNLVGLSILISCAATLHQAGIFSIDTAAQAAQSLRPIAGAGASALFTVGVVGTGLLSVPVLAGSAAYAIGEARRWPVGLSRQPLQAKAFYLTIALATCLGAGANMMAIKPLQALVWAAVINGIVAVPVMALLMRMSMRPDIMGPFVIGLRWQIVGWIATAVMLVAAVALCLVPG